MNMLADLINGKKTFDILTGVLKISEAPFDTVIQAENQKNILLIQSWLFKIGEPEEYHYIVLDKCKNDPEVLEYFLKHIYGEFEVKNTIR